ncbi:MAG: hypothetical protein ACLT98_10580 [Eggerthellaceae bacterium]
MKRIVSPGTLDGGDVADGGRPFYVGQSARTNRAFASSARSCKAGPRGFEVKLEKVCT